MSLVQDHLEREFSDHQRVVAHTLAAVQADFARLVGVSVTALQAGNKLLFFGNGGSAADAQHIATELVVRFQKDRRALAAMALTTDSSTLTAIGNDFGFDHLFSRQIEACVRSGDVAIGLSTSGNSANVLLGLEQARKLGGIAAGFTGGTGGKMAAYASPLLIVQSQTTARIQELHILLGHALCGAIERELGLAG